MRRLATISRSLFVLVGVGGAVTGSWWLLDEHQRALRNHEAVTRVVAARLGGNIGALVAQDRATDITGAVSAWLTDQPRVRGVRVVEDSGKVHAAVSRGAASGMVTTQIQVLRNDTTWGSVFIDTVGPDDRLSVVLRRVNRVPSGTWVGLPALAIVAAAAAARLHAPGMGRAWREARDRVESTLDFLAEGVLITDTAGRLLFANAPARALMPAAGRGVRVEDLPWDVAQPGVSVPGAWWLNSGSAIPVRVIAPDGVPRSFIARTLSIRHGRRAMGYLLTLNDVTELEDGRRQLAVAKAAADSANQAKGVFLANMSHEIRTPITGVLGSLDLLERTALTSTQERYLEAAQVSATALHHLINDIIDLSRIEAGRVEIAAADFDLEECLVGALKVVADNAAAKGLELTLRIAPGVPGAVRGDFDRLRQVVLNLVANGVKFTGAGGVHVSARAEAEGVGRFRLRVDVRDTGIGIPAHRMDRLFKFFSQAESSTIRKYGGSGLGLAISRQLCELMGGGVHVESVEGQGSTFSLWVTLGESVAGAAREARREPDVDGRPCIVIDPREHTRAALVELASRAGLRVVDGAAARPPAILIGCDQFTPDVALAGEVAKAAYGAGTHLIVGLSRDVTPDVECKHAHLVDGWIRIPASSQALRRCLLDSRGGAPARTHERSEPEPLLLATGLRLLIAEDHPITQMITGEAAAAAGFEHEIASTGPAALEAALSGRFHALLLDCHLPDLDGLEIARRIRTAEKDDTARARLVIIALTASAMAEDRGRCLEAGMDAYLTKPIRRDHLINELRRLTGATQRPSAVTVAPALALAEPSAEPVPAEAGPAGGTFDLRELTERCLDDPSMVRTMLDLFISATVVDLERLADAVRHAARADIQALAHRVAGAAFQVTARDVAHAAKALEDAPESPTHFESMRDAFEQFRKAASA